MESEQDTTREYLVERVAALEAFIEHFLPALIQHAPNRMQIEADLLEWEARAPIPVEGNAAAELLAAHVYNHIPPP